LQADYCPIEAIMQKIHRYLQENRQRFEEDLCELLRIPSVSADGRCRDAIRQAADWLKNQLASLGLPAELIPTAGAPLVYAESPAVANTPTVLVYGHYDVQPPEPLDLWTTPPFEPTVRDGNVYARGATDDKGQLLTHVKSAEAWLKTHGALPMQLKFLFEGEEEVGSDSLNAYLDRAADRLACDLVVISDSSQFGPGQPAITYGLRGIAYFELRIRGPQTDLHSGAFGGSVTNPVQALATMLSGLLDASGRIQVPGFYDDVIPMTDDERERLAALRFDDARFLRQLGVTAANGEAGYTTLERRWTRPSLDINGIWGGYQGEGSKTVLPGEAAAKFSFRLVPDQQAEKITAGLRQRLEQLCPPGIRWELIEMHSAPAVLVPPDSPYVSAAQRAIEHGFGQPPVLVREGGSIPIVADFREKLGVDTLLLGWGLDDDNMHAPNEKFSLADFHRGIRASAHLWQELSVLDPQR
jgi:acetylornithine deacetylase/succinyl-diaminopimelate desuccinylase-like protein